MIYTHSDIQNAVQIFQNCYMIHYKLGETKKNYYCGITNDVDERKELHNVEDFLVVIECDSFDTSSAIESALQADGFNVGASAGHGRNNSVYVYMYKITSSTRQ